MNTSLRHWNFSKFSFSFPFVHKFVFVYYLQFTSDSLCLLRDNIWKVPRTLNTQRQDIECSVILLMQHSPTRSGLILLQLLRESPDTLIFCWCLSPGEVPIVVAQAGGSRMNGPFQHLHSVISPQAASSPSLAQPSPDFLHSARLSLRWNMNPDDSALLLKERNNFRMSQCNRKRKSRSVLFARVTWTQRDVSTPLWESAQTSWHKT